MAEPNIDSLPQLTAREAYLAMLEFLATEFALANEGKILHLGGLLSELEPELDGSSADPGGVSQFVEAVLRVKSASYKSAWSSLNAKDA